MRYVEEDNILLYSGISRSGKDEEWDCLLILEGVLTGEMWKEGVM